MGHVRRESNPHRQFRKLVLYPLSYGRKYCCYAAYQPEVDAEASTRWLGISA